MLCLTLILLCIFTIITIDRGFQWRSASKLYSHDITTSQENFVAYNILSGYLIGDGNLNEAKLYTLKSISIYPLAQNYQNLGAIYFDQGNFTAALVAFNKGAEYKSTANNALYENIAELTLVTGDFNTDKSYITRMLNYYPTDHKLWLFLALFDQEHNDNADAKFAITQSEMYGATSQIIFNDIQTNTSFDIPLGPKTIKI